MEFVFAIPLLLLPLALPLVAGLMARSFGRSFRFWFLISFLLPFISCLVLLCLPEKKEEVAVVENEEVFDHLFINKQSKQITDHETQSSARA